MKIGILTFHCAYNFGAVLQSYALYSFLKMQQYEVELVNYCPPYLETLRPQIGFKDIITNRKRFRLIKNTLREQSRYDKYTSFISKYMSLSERCRDQESYDKIITKYDVVIIGSDQVWNLTYNGNDPIWYGKGVKGSQRLIAYAVSAGDPNFSQEQKEYLKGFLTLFSNISVREECLQNVVTPLTSKRVTTVLDPSLMVPLTVWENWMSKKVQKSIVIYQARVSDYVFKLAKSISKKTGYPIVTVDIYRNSIKSGYFKNLSPEDFFVLVNNAYCVITTSFHGTAFSIITNTPFFTVRLHDGADARSEALLDRLGALDRMVEVDTIVNEVEMDFTSINLKLETLRRESQEFLLDCLQS